MGFQVLACAINASCLALLNSGISMKFTIAAVNCMLEKETGNLIMDPDSTQLQVFITIHIFLIQIIGYSFINNPCIFHRMQKQHLHMHLTASRKISYAATLSADSRKANSYPAWISADKPANMCLIIIEK